MAKRSIDSNIETHLINNEPFEYAHLVKFERPFDAKDGEFRTNANRYVYLTDGARDISFDDGSGNGAQIYRANRLISVGNYSETTQARATNMSLVLSGEPLGLSYVVTGSLSSGSFATTVSYKDGRTVDFVEAGFIEGDKVKIVKSNGTNFSDGDSEKIFIISGFSNNNQTLALQRTGTDTDDNDFVNLNDTSLTFTLESEELKGALLERGTDLANPSFLNREVFVHKVFFDPDNLTTPIGSTSILTFKGIISGTDISEGETSSRVKWNLTSHWGDFQQASGRIGTDELHRALDANGKPQPLLALRPEYATDLGFLHAETSLNTIAIYQTTETRYEIKTKKRGGFAGLTGQKKQYIVETQEEVDNEIDLSVFLQGRYIPVVYGVQRVEGVPVFADTKSDNSKEVYVAYTIAEGEIHGLYNMYIDGAPLICTDLNDFSVRNSSSGTDKDNSQLQCYGRADRGDTLSGDALVTTTSYPDYSDEIEKLENLGDGGIGGLVRRAKIAALRKRETIASESSITSVTADSSSYGLQHEETASISHPYTMKFAFHMGRLNQKSDVMLNSIAASNGFKRQNDYFTSTESYWSPDHKLLDTAYSVMKFEIDEDQTTVPEIEYVVKGKLLECFNYDGTYKNDAVLGASDSHTNFSEGDDVTVEVSTDGSSWSALSGTFRILDKYSFTTSRGTAFYRFRLDSVPDLSYTNGVPSKKYLRLKSGSDYWHMITYNNDLVGTAESFPEQEIASATLSTDSSGELSATVSSGDASTISTIFPDITDDRTTSDAFFEFYNIPTELLNVKYSNLQGTLDGTTLNFPGTNYGANNSVTVNVQPAGKYDFSGNTTVNAVTDANEIVGCILTIIETGEQREIIAFDTTNKFITLDAPFITTPNTDNTFTITGRGRDLRASTNPAIQTLDYLTNDKYGKGLILANDIDLASFKTSALLCDTRSDVTMNLASAASCTAGDVYKLTDDGTSSGNHVASGKVLTTTSSSSQVVFTEMSHKFMRPFYNYINYNVGDIIYTTDNTYYRVDTAGLRDSVTSGTTLISSLTLHKVSGSGPSTLSVAVDGKIPTYSLYDSDYVQYWRYLGWEDQRQSWATRHQTSFIFDTSRPIFDNINALLSHFNGILSYANGKYVLDVETQVTTPVASTSQGIQSNPLYIDESDIIGSISIVDNSQRNSKNTIKASIPDPANNWGSRSVSFFNSDFLKADRNIVKTGTFPFTGLTSYYNARIGVEKELIQSRFSKEVSFTVGPRGILLKAGEVIALTYEPFGFSSKLFRIENLNFLPNCNVSVKAREYDDSIYAITPQRASSAQRAATGGDFSLKPPTAPTLDSVTTTKPGIITLNWTNASNFKEAIDSTEIWRASTQGTSGEITAHASLIGVVDNATTFSDAVGEAGTFYYWIRHRRLSSFTQNQLSKALFGGFNDVITAGTAGTAKVLSPQLDVDISSITLKFNDSGVLTPSGSAQDVTLTATLRNITPTSGVTFTILDADQSSQTDVQFTNASTTVTDTTSPYQAVVDASSASNATTNKLIKVTTTDTSGEVFNELIPLTVTLDGSAGGTGVDAIAIKLLQSTSVITYGATDDTETPSGQTITFTTDVQGSGELTGTAYYEFLIDGATSQNSTTSTFTLPDADEPGPNETVQVRVKLRDGGTTGDVKAQDTVTIYGLKDGSDAITAFLTNSAHVVAADNDGSLASGALDDAGGTFKVYVGTTDVTTSCTFSEVAGQETSGLTSTINSSTGVYEVTGLTVDLAVNTFRASIPSNISPTGDAVTIDQTYSISKSVKGNSGSNGTDSKTVRLTAADYSIVYDQDGANPDPSGTITLTASSQNFDDPYFKFTGDGITDETSYTDGTGDNDTFSFTVPSSHFTTPKTLRVGVAEAAASTTEVAFDTISIFGVKEGTNSYTVILDNEAHTFSADSNGSISSYSGSGATIEVFKGGTELNGITTGTPTTGEFKVTVSTESNITAGSISSTGNPVVIGDHSSMTGTSASIIYSINVENIQTILKKQTFTRTDDGADGQDGATGNSIAEVSVYKQVSLGSSAPATPSGGSFDLTTGILTVPTGWSKYPPIFNFGSDLYLSIGLVNDAPTETAASVSWATPVKQFGIVPVANFIFQRSATQPTTPSSTTYGTTPTGWYDDTGSVPSGANPIWASKGETSTSGTTTWQTPFQLEGTDGADGDEGAGTTTIYYLQTGYTAPSTPSSGSSLPPTGWSTTVPTPAAGKSIWQSFGTKAAGGTSWTWAAPTIYIEFDYSFPGLFEIKFPTFDLSASGLGALNLVNTDYANSSLTSGNVTSGLGFTPLNDLASNIANLTTFKTNLALQNVTNESKTTMFSSPTFTGTVSGVTSTHVGLGNVANKRQVDVDLTNAPSGILNNNLSLSFSSNTLTLSGGGGSAQTINKSTLGLNYTDGADITSQNTAAAISGQGSLATRNDVRAGTHIKNAAGSATLGDADIITSQGTAASISGQGALATQSSADFSTQVSGAQKPANNATNNGTTINTSGNVTGSMSVASGGSITIGNVTIDGTNGRILITD